MPRYTVYIEEDPESGSLPFVHAPYEDLAAAGNAVRAAELSYPNGVVWVEDEEGKVIPLEDLAAPDPAPDLSYIPPDPDEVIADVVRETLGDIRREWKCPHNWQMMSDGLFHCYYACGVHPHEPHPDEVGD